MTRTTDDMHDAERFQPLGPPIPRPAPPPPAPKPQGPAGLVADAQGRLSTTTHKPGP